MTFREQKQDIWSALGRATVDRKHPWRYPVLASVSENKPEQRTVVLRAYDPSQNCLFFYTDQRSPKVTQLQTNPQASLLFYHPRKQWQIRVQGIITLHHRDELALEHLAKIPLDRRSDYRAAAAPGEQISEAKELMGSAEANFCLLSFQAELIDSLVLGKEEHLRYGLNLQEETLQKLQA